MPSRRLLAALVSAAAAGCAAPAPAAPERTVYVIRELPAVLATPAEGPANWGGPPRTVTAPQVVHDDPEAEAARRAWLEENYYRPRIQVVEQTAPDGRYVPEKQVPRERIVVVEREPSRVWLPPINLSLGYWGGHGHHDDGWGWGVGWGFPLWGW